MDDQTLALEATSDKASPYVAPGLPPLDMSGKTVSSFEFWPTWVMYFPVVLRWLGWSIRYGSPSLPLNANPHIALSGMVGFSKSQLLSQASEASQSWILPWIRCEVGNCDQQLQDLLVQMKQQGFSFPIVGKPDMGCRGAGVKLLKNEQALADYLRSYPEGASFMLQQLSTWEPEAGVFYVRHPGQQQGKIVSLALKYSPYVLGDGQRTLAQLLDADPRAKDLRHLYDERHADQLDRVIPKDEPYRLVFSASHSRGAIFRDAQAYITPALEQRIDEILQGLPEFYYGRLDVKFKDMDALQLGETLEIVEINGASSESLHIWDKDTSLSEAITALTYQYGTLFKIGAANRQRGFRSPSLWQLFKAWRHEAGLIKRYPQTD